YTSLLFVFFFFQAEDGIRDFHVTGVQTCALPISQLRAVPGVRHPALRDEHRREHPVRPRLARAATHYGGLDLLRLQGHLPATLKIGRASCRERVEASRVSVGAEKKKRCQEKDTHL